MKTPSEPSPLPSAGERITALRRAIAWQPELQMECAHVRLEPIGGGVRLAGEVDTIVAKRRLPLVAAEIFPGGVADELRLRHPAGAGPRPSDAELARKVLQALREEGAFGEYRIDALGPASAGAEDAGPGPVVLAGARDGRVRLAGTVGSLTHRRLAEVLAWWVPGTADVDNRLYVAPPEADSDDEITDAVRLVLEKDPWIHVGIDAAQVAVRTRARRVRLAGVLPTPEQARMAEHDAWRVLGVHAVVNDIRIAGGAP